MAERRAWASGWLVAVLAFVLAVPLAAVTAYLVFESLKAGAAGDEPPRTLLALYDPPASDVPGLPVGIYGPDEERVPLPTLSHEQIIALSSPLAPLGTPPPPVGATSEPTPGVPGATTAPDASPTPTRPAAAPTPSAGLPTPTAAEPSASPAGTATDPPTDGTSPSPGDGGPAPGFGLDVDFRPAAIEVETDLCMLHARVPGCPDGIPGTVIDSLPPPPDLGGVTDVWGDRYVVSALVNRDPAAAEYAELAGGGCAPPADGSVSLLILSHEILHYDITYWPVRFMPEGEDRGDASTTRGDTIFDRSAVPYRFYHCPRLRIGDAVAFDVSIRLTDFEGNVGWPPVYQFCLDCRELPPGTRLALGGSSAVELHPDWVAGILYSPPANGALEFAYRLPGGSWRSRLNTAVRRGEEARVRTPPTLLPGTRYEYQMRLWPADGGPIYESAISIFDTLRWNVTVQPSRFDVADEGTGQLWQIDLDLCADPVGGYSRPASADDCATRLRAWGSSLDVVGRDTVSGGLHPDAGLSIEDGDIIAAEFERPELRLEGSSSRSFHVALWSTDRLGTCRFPECQWIGHFTIPPYFEARATECVPDVNTFVLRTSPIARGVEPRLSYFINTVGGPMIRPTQLSVCVRQVR